MKKMTVLKIQQLTGLLNFLCKAYYPARPFTRRIHSKGKGLKQDHHVRVDSEMRLDCQVWIKFLQDNNLVTRPWVNVLAETYSAEELDFYSDTMRAENLRFGGIFENSWVVGQWQGSYIRRCQPSIEYLELYAVMVNIMLWAKDLANRRVIIFCDNESIVSVINKDSLSCRNCLKLLRLITLTSLKYNTRFFAHHVKGKNNILLDLLCRQKIRRWVDF